MLFKNEILGNTTVERIFDSGITFSLLSRMIFMINIRNRESRDEGKKRRISRCNGVLRNKHLFFFNKLTETSA